MATLTLEEIKAEELRIAAACEAKRLADLAAAEAEEQKIVADLEARKAAHEQAKWNAYNANAEARSRAIGHQGSG